MGFRKFSLVLLSVGTALALSSVPVASAQSASGQAVPDFEYHGYMRSGLGFSRGGTDQVCYSAPGSETGKFRLGNECDTYIEAAFVKSVLLGKAASDPLFKTHFRFAATSGGDRDWEGTSPEGEKVDEDGKPVVSQEFTLALREAFVEGHNVLGKAHPWVGKRYYRRHDVHILDFYLINNSGPGAGVEGIDLGVGQLHLAVTRNIPAGTDDGPAQTNADVRFSDISIASGKLEAIVLHGAAGNRAHESGDDLWEPVSGQQLALVHSQDALGGFNRVTAQYGLGIYGGIGAARKSALSEYGAWGTQNIAKGDKDTSDARADSSTLRVTEELVAQFGKSLAASFVLVYQDVDFGGFKDEDGKETPNKTETTAGLRPVYSFTDTAGVALEYGLTSVDNAFIADGEYESATLHKLTLAPQIAAGPGFWARPQLRVFASYASWNKEAKGQIGDQVYAGDSNGFSTGAQLEAWW